MHLKYRADIDGLRTLAVLSVLIFHLNGAWLTGGFVGVDVFFVISGYLITKIIVREVEAKEFSFARFYERRIRRIFPALFAMMLFSAVMAYLSLPRGAYKSFFEDFKFAAAQISNFRFAREVDYMGVGVEASPLLHTWSLAVEEQFYLVWPIFIMTVLAFSCKKWLKASMVTLAVASLATCVYLLNVDDINNAFYMFYARAYELAIGAIVALHLLPKIEKKWLGDVLSAIGVSMVLIAVFTFTKKTLFPGFAALLPSVGTAVLIYVGGQQQGVVQRVLSLKPVVGIGLISYSLYLWHWPLITYYKSFMDKELNVLEGFVIGGLSFAMAYLSYRFIETPFRSPKNKISNRKLFAYSFAFVLLLVVAAHQMRTHENRIWGRQIGDDLTTQKYFKQMNEYHGKCMFDVERKVEVKAECSILGNENSDKYDVVVVGDSHSIHYMPTLETWAKEQHKNIFVAPKSSCPIFLHSDYKVVSTESGDDKCTMAQMFTNKFIKENNIKHIIYAHKQTSFLNDEEQVIVVGESDNALTNYLALWEYEVSENHKRGVRTTFLSQVPEYDINQKHCYQSYKGTPVGFLRPGSESDCYHEAKRVNVPLRANVDKVFTDLQNEYDDFNVFYPDDYLLSIVDDNGDILYVDKHHINIYGSRKLEPAVTAFLNNQR